MKVEKLSANKLKITLTDNDLMDFDIDLEELCYDSELASEFFHSLLGGVDDNLGFFTDGSRLIIEAMRSADDKFVMTVTKVDDDDFMAPFRHAKAKIKKKPQPVVYRFDNLSDAADACKRISIYFAGKSRFYKYSGSYYLMVDGVNSFVAKDSDVLLCDYGTKAEQGDGFEGVLAEKGEALIKEDAVEILCSYF